MTRLILTLSLLVMLSGTAWAAGDGSETTAYLLVLFLHQILFVFWLGPDIGIYMWSTKATNPECTPGQRVSAGRIMRVIDIIPKVCMSLMLTIGGILTEMMGIEHPWWQMIGIVLLGPIWLTLTLMTFRSHGTEAAAKMGDYDIWFRWLVVVSVVFSVGLAINTGRLEETPWITGKLMLFAAIVFFGILMRRRLVPFMAAIEKMDAEGPSEAIDAQLSSTMGSARLFMFASWISLAAAAALGVIQPGG